MFCHWSCLLRRSSLRFKSIFEDIFFPISPSYSLSVILLLTVCTHCDSLFNLPGGNPECGSGRAAGQATYAAFYQENLVRDPAGRLKFWKQDRRGYTLGSWP